MHKFVEFDKLNVKINYTHNMDQYTVIIELLNRFDDKITY